MQGVEILTAHQVDRLREPATLKDARYRGLRLVASVSASGRLRKVWFYRYRTRAGRLRQIKLGEYPGMNLAAAAASWQSQKALRDDPSRGDPRQELQNKANEIREALEEDKRKGYSVAKLCRDYLSEHIDVRRVRRDEPRRLLEKEVIPVLGDKTALDVRRNHVHELIQHIIARGAPRVAQMVKTELKAAFEHAITAGRIPDSHANPCWKVKAPPQRRRTRAFSEQELQAFLAWLPAARVSRTVRDVMHLELLTSARQGEIVAMQWKHVDLKRAIWAIPNTKNGRPHDVMLSTQACEILKARKGLHDLYVFPLPNGKGAVASKAIGIQQYAARDALDVATWTVHDLRRSAMTGLARLGCPRQVQDRIANHVDGSVAAIYDRHSYDDEARKWLQIWADSLDQLTGQVETSVKRVERTRSKSTSAKRVSDLRLVATHSG